MKRLRRSAWKLVAQTGELRFHQRNAWRQSPDFMKQTAALFTWWGYSADAYRGESIVDIGAGSRLRTRYFDGAKIIAIEPLADRFMRTISWSDLGEAEAVYAKPAEEFLPVLADSASLVMCINVLDHTYDPAAVVANAYAYLKPGADLIVSVDLHEHGEAGLMHPVHLDRESLGAALAESGFELVREYDGLGPTGAASYGHGHAYTAIARRPVV